METQENTEYKINKSSSSWKIFNPAPPFFNKGKTMPTVENKNYLTEGSQ